MSNRHTHRKRTPARKSRGKWLALLIVLAVAAIVALLRLQVLRTAIQSSPAAILDLRVTRVGPIDSSYGGSILYRLEVLARFEQDGATQTRWIPASRPSSDWASLRLQILQKPDRCTASWPRNHPKSVRCTLN